MTTPTTATTIARTIPDLKQSFLIDQIRLLSAPLRPGIDWRDRDDDHDPEEEDHAEGERRRRGLSNAIVAEVLHKGISFNFHLVVVHHFRYT